MSFTSGSAVENPPAMQEMEAIDMGSIPTSGKSPRERKLSSILAWKIPIHGLQKSDMIG